jgi:hypothetical protein
MRDECLLHVIGFNPSLEKIPVLFLRRFAFKIDTRKETEKRKPLYSFYLRSIAR